MDKLAGITPFTMGKLLEALQIITRFWVKWWTLPENKYQFLSKVAGAPDYSGETLSRRNNHQVVRELVGVIEKRMPVCG